jgi:hypothetical protein
MENSENDNVKFINACFLEKLNLNILNPALKDILDRNKYLNFIHEIFKT